MTRSNPRGLAGLSPLLVAAACAGPAAPAPTPPPEPVAAARAPEPAQAPEPAAAPGEPVAAAPAGESRTPQTPAPWSGATSFETNGGAYRICFLPPPEEIPDNDLFALDVWVLDAATGEPADVELWVDAAMPEHGHGMVVVPEVARGASGALRVEGMLFHMPGRWELYFDVTRGPLTERGQLNVVLE